LHKQVSLSILARSELSEISDRVLSKDEDASEKERDTALAELITDVARAKALTPEQAAQ
jgi:hypothetical protein